MKWTKAKINKLSTQELQDYIDKAKGVRTVYSGASKNELVREFIYLLNSGKIN